MSALLMLRLRLGDHHRPRMVIFLGEPVQPHVHQQIVDERPAAVLSQFGDAHPRVVGTPGQVPDEPSPVHHRGHPQGRVAEQGDDTEAV